MSKHKNIDRICVVIVAITLIIAMIFCSGNALGIEMSAHAIGYENRIFNSSGVHTIDIVMNNWDSFIETCMSEEYSSCSVVIDGEAFKNVGIRAKGNTSLNSVSRMNSSRYSFKIEFDRYDSTKSYYGLDKLCLNNVIYDNTYMKDYLSYTLMGKFGVDSPLCSYVYITVNGEDWGLYLAVEGVEESFLQRNYGKNYGELYKPDMTGFGGGRGNGIDFSMSDFMDRNSNGSEEKAKRFSPQDVRNRMPDFGNMGGMGSNDVKLQYIDDDPDSYSNIFDSAKTYISDSDKKRLIGSLKNLSEGTDIESTVDIDKVIRYFVVHNFLCNGDSYTGSMVHNYYLYEEKGKLSIIPWDYNLAFGTFQGANASSSVNAAIDTPVAGDISDRPMISWIFDNEEYTELYHKLFSKFINETDFSALIDETAAMISEYVEEDPTKFCTYEEFKTGVSAIRTFCQLREESVQKQLNGTIPSTSDGQSADSTALIDTSSLNISEMGTMSNGGFGRFGGGQILDNVDGKSPENFDPSAMFGGNMPGGFGGDMRRGDNITDAQSGDPAESGSVGTNNFRPPFGEPMNVNSHEDSDPLPLLGISVGVLIIGLITALKFKR